ncbi:MAG: hypothetical protein ACXWH0_04975 [Acidimicrobiia bacterium]
MTVFTDDLEASIDFYRRAFEVDALFEDVDSGGTE